MARAAQASPRRKRARWKRVAVGALIAVLVTMLLGAGGFLYLYTTTKLPNPNSDFTTNTTFLYYNDGRNQLGSLAVQNRVSLEYDQMPQVMKDAVIAAENRSFWEDPGFSASGIARGAWHIATGGEVQGGSTITQQYIKILYLTSERTMTRKARELILAIKMGREMPKEEILEGYLNTIYFGRGAYGIQAAARSYFLKDAKDLTMPEAAALAAILNNPAGFNPSGGQEKLDKLLGRYRYVLDGLLEMGKITAAQRDQAAQALPRFPEVPVNNRYGGPKGFLIKMVEAELQDLGFSEADIQGGGLKVVTTFDKGMQAAAIQTAQKYTAQAAADAEGGPDPSKLHAAISSVDTRTGSVLALYGGADYVSHSRNWATTARPAASTFKSFAAVAGMRHGFTLRSRFKGDSFTPRGDSKPIRNEFGEEYGRVSLRRAIADSINTAFVDLTEQMDNGPQEVMKAANDAGAPKGPGWDANNRVALGAAEVSPLNMANSYATFADSGKYKAPHVVLRVEDRDGAVKYEAKPEAKQQIDQNIAANLTDALTSVVSEGTGRKAGALERPVAGKTGTHGVEDTIQSAWFVGYTRQISTAVMFVAGDAGVGDLDAYKRPRDRTFFGSTYPLMTWVDFMKAATDGQDVEEFDEPHALESKDDADEGDEEDSGEAGQTRSPEPDDQTRTEPVEPQSPTPDEQVTQTPVPGSTPTSSEDRPTKTPAAPTQPPTGEPTSEPTRTAGPPSKPSAPPPSRPTLEPPSRPSAEPPAKPSGRPAPTAEATA